ncbi:MAG: tyrosine-protein kinase Etk/Wzc, partial [Salibacteraceae bacterium]
MIQETREDQNESLDLYKDRLTKFSQEFELGLFIHLAQKSLIWILLFLSISFCSAYLYLRYYQPMYQSTSILQLKESNQASQLLELDFGKNQNQDMMSDLEVIKSKEFLKTIFKKLPLDISYFNEGELLNYELYMSSPYFVDYDIINSKAFLHKYYVYFPNSYEIHLSIDEPVGASNYQKFPINKLIELPYLSFSIKILDFDIIQNDQETESMNDVFFVLNNNSSILNKYSNSLDIRVLNESAQSISISFTDENPRKAADLSNAISTGFIDYDLDRKIHSSTQVINFIDSQISEVYGRLKESEVSIQEFKLSNKVTGSVELTGVYLDRLGNLEEELINQQLEQEILKQVKRAASGNYDSVEVHELIPFLTGTQFEDNLMQQIAYVQELQIEKEQSLYEVTATSGRVQNLDYQVRIQKKLLTESIISMELNLKARISSLTQKISEIESTFSGLPLQELKYTRLKRIFAINEKFYTLLLEKKAEYAIAKAGIVPECVILEKATPDHLPIEPNIKMTYII